MDEPTEPEAAPGIVLGDRHVRMLRVAVIAMGVILIVGLAAVVARVVYLVGRGGSKASLTAESTLKDRALVTLPSGAVVRNVSLSGPHLAMQYDAPSGSGIVILDLATGKVISRVDLAAGGPR